MPFLVEMPDGLSVKSLEQRTDIYETNYSQNGSSVSTNFETLIGNFEVVNVTLYLNFAKIEQKQISRNFLKTS